MNEKKLLRSNLDEIKGIKKLTTENITIINNFIEDKIVCTYIHTDSEIDINNDISGYKQLITTYLFSSEIELCLYKEPFIKNTMNTFNKSSTIWKIPTRRC